jgi:hypothetical protein
MTSNILYPPFPAGMTREQCVDGLKAVRDMVNDYLRTKDPEHKRFPDLDELLLYLDEFGFPPKEDDE